MVRTMSSIPVHANRRKVVVGIESIQPMALKFAAKAAVAHGVGLRVIHCATAPAVGEFVTVPNDVWQSAGRSLLDDASDILGDSISPDDVEYELLEDLPFSTLLDEANSGAPMVVVGVDTTGWFEDLLDGSVAHRLATHSPVPVAVVPERPWTAVDAGDVFVAIDGRSPATGPLRFAFEEADQRRVGLQVLHVVPEDDMFYRSMSHRVQVAEVLAGWSEEFPDVRVTRRQFFDEADEGTIRASEEAALLVLGRRSENGLARLLGHPVLAEVTRRVQCPCVIVPDESVEHRG
jgi:nucleotide-binding universal stress UspA family protein